ncbi:MAG: allantoinase AllB [Thermoanaerobaculia bacterium]
MVTGSSLLLRSRRVVTPDGARPATVVVRNGRIEAVERWSQPSARGPIVDVGDHVVLPGLVDTHVHANDPGRAEWEGFDCATRAAAGGGVTTLVDMPLNSVPATTTPRGLAAKRAAAKERLWVDVGLWGGAVPDNREHLAALWEGGVLGFKAFLAPSGVEEFPPLEREGLRKALVTLAGLGAVLLVHAELPAQLDVDWAEKTAPESRRRYAAYLASRPPAAEVAAVELVAELAEQTGARAHIVHVASAEAVDAVRAARRRGVALSAETCPHYLTAAAEEIPDGATLWKCAPPIRESGHREALWQALVAGDLELVASDHSPTPPAGKHLETGDFGRAWGGVASLQLLLPLVWTGSRERSVPIERLAEWLAAAPARLAGLTGRKGAIASGHDADLVIFDPEATFPVDPDRLFDRHRLSPYAGRRLAGRVRRVFLRGVEIFDGERVRERATGRLLKR